MTMKNIKQIFLLVAAVASAVLCGCVNDDVPAPTESATSTVIQLGIGDPEEVEVTRSVATTAERQISDAYLLIFDGTSGKYIYGEKLDLTTQLTGNGNKKPTITTSFIIPTGSKVIVLANTTYTDTPATLGFTVGTTTEDDINSIFWRIKYMANYRPMSGKMIWGTDTECPMIRSVAKIEVRVDEDLFNQISEDEIDMFDIRFPFPTLYAGITLTTYTWIALYNSTDNILTPQKNILYNLNTTSAAEDTYYSYSPEFPNASHYPIVGQSTLGTINNTDFDSRRYSVSIRVKHKNDLNCVYWRYYRLDFYDPATKKYIDVKRNNHYIFTINKVNTEGYFTLNEASVNPGTNIEYDLQVVDYDANNSTANGQYALTVSSDEINIFNDNSDLLNINFNVAATANGVNVATACAEFIDPTTKTNIDIPEELRPLIKINDNIIESGLTYNWYSNLPNVSGISETRYFTGIRLVNSGGSLTSSQSYTMSLSGMTTENQALLKETLNGKILRITIGNIQRDVTIHVNDVTFYYGTANSIEIPVRAGDYIFDATPHTTTSSLYAYQNKPDLELAIPRSAAMLWSDVSANHLSNITVEHREYSSTYQVRFTSSGTAGNAVIAIYDTADPADPNAKILWSFHVWVSSREATSDQNWSTLDLPNNTILHNRLLMMDRFLGASSNDKYYGYTTAYVPTYLSSAGLYYQWGRKDPFMPVANFTSKTPRTRYTAGGTVITTLATEAKSATTGTVEYATRNPMTFITSANDWIYGNIYNTDTHALWGSRNNYTNATWHYPTPIADQTKSVFDPCPAGYRVAPSDAYTMICRPNGWVIGGSNGVKIIQSGANQTNPNWCNCVGVVDTNYPKNNYGIDFYYQDDRSGPTTYLPNCGDISYNGTYENNISQGGGLIHTNSDLTPTNAATIRCSWSVTSINFMWITQRGTAMSLRCCRE